MSFYTEDFLAEGIARRGWEIGKYTYGSPIVHSWGDSDGHLKIGRYCSIAGNVEILLGGNHRPDWVTTYPFSALRAEAAHIQGHPASKGPVTIGNDVWLGNQCMILSGVTIGDGAVIGARAVVSRDVPPYAIVTGNPARVVRRRFSDEQIALLLEIRWWDWPDERIAQHYPLLQSGDLDAFFRACGHLA